MKIAFIASSKNIIPPDKSGGVEYEVYYLARELARQGHGITLYAAPGSRIQGVEVKAMSPFPATVEQEFANLEERITSFYDLSFLAHFFHSGEWRKYDLIHYNNYLFYEILPFAPWCDIPVIARMNYPHTGIFPYLKDGIDKYKNVFYLPTSKFIAKTMPGLNYLDPVFPAIDFDDFAFSGDSGEYLLFIGRICPEKGAHIAVDIARRTKEKLVIAGPVSRAHFDYFNDKIRPFIDNQNIVYIGEADFRTKRKAYQKAKATLFPVQWDEPFGIVLLESMACGTPVVAFDRAAVREIVEADKTGFIVPEQDAEQMEKAIKKIPELDRRKVRQGAKDRHSIEGWAKKYSNICNRLIAKN